MCRNYIQYISDTCTELPAISNIRTAEAFPVNYGTEVTVSCSTDYKLYGDEVITCQQGVVFHYDNIPVCIRGGYNGYPPSPYPTLCNKLQSFDRFCFIIA